MKILREIFKLREEKDKTKALEEDLKNDRELRHEVKNRLRGMEIEAQIMRRRRGSS